ncbi:Crp/Fnr family transcriptional regulator [Levilactobacillus huananensis]|uniref:Crp/Fnr family transcriptional regulator n=1 Tax=Levilactobacillus huananensis TaxID=2486019 RepID=UPI000F790B8B|nr:Crp/Fnr family transcriptional regulator [Levilactobacillus huananensis]
MKTNYEEELLLILNDKGSSLRSENITGKLQHYASNDIIVNQQDDITDFCILINGSASVWNKIAWDEGQIVGHVYPLEILGLIEYLNDIKFYTADVMAESECLVYKIPTRNFMKSILKNGSLGLMTLKKFAISVSLNMTNAEKKTLFKGVDILGHYLYVQAQGKIPYVCPFTRQELADKLKINLRTLYRYIVVLGKQDHLEVRRGKITITGKQFIQLQKRYQKIIF